MTKLFPKDKSVEISQSPHSPHNIIPSLISPHKTILDLGCNNGVLGYKLRHNHNQIDGVDINSKYFSKAKKYYRELYQLDLSKMSLPIQKKYDYIVLSDILEHLPNPDEVLLKCKKYLNNNGKLIISLPNVARLEIRLSLLFGNFDYGPGIMSPDHLRFFTKKSAIKLINQSGYRVDEIKTTGFAHKYKIFPLLTSYQFIFICSRS